MLMWNIVREEQKSAKDFNLKFGRKREKESGKQQQQNKVSSSITNNKAEKRKVQQKIYRSIHSKRSSAESYVRVRLSKIIIVKWKLIALIFLCCDD